MLKSTNGFEESRLIRSGFPAYKDTGDKQKRAKRHDVQPVAQQEPSRVGQ